MTTRIQPPDLLWRHGHAGRGGAVHCGAEPADEARPSGRRRAATPNGEESCTRTVAIAAVGGVEGVAALLGVVGLLAAFCVAGVARDARRSAEAVEVE